MNVLKKLGLVSALAIVLATTAQAATQQPILLSPQTIVWSDVKNMPAGAKMTVLSGDPSKKKPFVIRIKLPANYTVPLHSHPITEFETVISGTYYLGTGKTMDLTKGIELPAGSFTSIPAHLKHYGWTKEETIVQISGVGPIGMIYSKS